MRRLLPFLVLFAAACTGTMGDDENAETMPDAAVAPPDDAPPPGDFVAVARGQMWVDAMVPYCQAPNHKPDADADCSSTCTRPDVAEWDPYRSDCSGFLSWAWGLPAPGRTTMTLAPYNTAVSHAIMAADLLPGDAINNDHHTMLLAAWIVPGMRARFFEEPGCATSQPYARAYEADVTLMGQMVIVKNRGTYTAIRHE